MTPRFPTRKLANRPRGKSWDMLNGRNADWRQSPAAKNHKKIEIICWWTPKRAQNRKAWRRRASPRLLFLPQIKIKRRQAMWNKKVAFRKANQNWAARWIFHQSFNSRARNNNSLHRSTRKMDCLHMKAFRVNNKKQQKSIKMSQFLNRFERR
jgi:hypothetical protein